MPKARNYLDKAGFAHFTEPMIYGVFDEVWARTHTKTERVAAMIVDAIIGLTKSGARFQEELVRYAAAQARMA